ncbi:hypothetical protein GWO43_06615 [candidate division KSB1 bacterium]|nr:hypothetical protein [candidate division KSB1 bacterium]NIR72540.1 hypothetical protein [candidate division KSB1 bacterium]NIS23635.1 hypothetical protein [candidate division KSB1 bacterium]NIT70559.1 hypothetical protein [candidate division KSB1 bacterium]NIU24277.1 hypothetical protein [candidate division KSB1 bacterium]
MKEALVQRFLRVRLMHITCLFVSLVGCSACAIFEPDKVDKTYPDAFDFELVSLQALLETVPAPASYNIEVYVIERNICPKDALCYLPDGITIAETKDPQLPEEGLHVPADEPRQFEIKGRYLMSVDVTEPGFDDPVTGKPVRWVTLLGYDRLE